LQDDTQRQEQHGSIVSVLSLHQVIGVTHGCCTASAQHACTPGQGYWQLYG
jgi:hypothetical protein